MIGDELALETARQKVEGLHAALAAAEDAGAPYADVHDLQIAMTAALDEFDLAHQAALGSA